jgi:3-hydroxymyristoyl/3-hydroxydecanoyl-(acyl carrier protein) dehydratase
MGYLFVDRILEVRTPGTGLRPGGRGIKAVSGRDPYLRPGPDGRLELSPCFAGEAVGQLAAWVAMSASGWRRRPVAGLTAEVLVEGIARVGDLLILEVEIESVEDDAVHYHGTARVGRQPIIAIRDAVGPMLPLEDFDDPAEVAREFRALLRPGEEPGASPLSHAGAREDGGGRPAGGAGFRIEDHPAIDLVLERHQDRVVAATCVTRTADYLAGHFPRNPVLPATLLLDGLVVLAGSLAGPEAGGAARAARLSDLKIRDFVRPGSRLISEVRIRERAADRVVADLSARLEGRAILGAVAELVREKGRGR